MFDPFTTRARHALRAAVMAAQRLGQDRINTEHVLLGIVSERDCVAAQVLVRLGIDLDKLRADIEMLAQPVAVPPSKLPQTPAAKHVVELAMAAAQAQGHGYAGTEHLLVGLLGESTGLAGQILSKLGITAADVCREMAEVLALDPAATDRFQS